MPIQNAKFLTSVGITSEYPDFDKVQIAFVGKSNVGKSTLINALCHQKKLAKTSQKPGKTRLINFFSINNDQYYLVDLPGYGFAKAPKEEKKRWGELIEGYLESGQVSHIFLLLDSRHSPTEDDLQMLRWIEYFNVPYTILATKVDKIAKSKRMHALQKLHKESGALSPPIGVSAEGRVGLNEVYERIDQIVNDSAYKKE